MNRLKNENSLYLKQHENNPVEWYPWSNEALCLAKLQNKPILLSIGYSACHWCHVMAHESFEDQDTANIMNENFINIKVDREERPDLDKVYQQLHHLMNQQPGGWPLTVFLTPDKLIPLFSGTYFPKERRYGRLSFKEVLRIVSQYYHQDKEGVAQDNQRLENAIQALEKDHPHADKITNVISLANKRWKAEFDPINGGIGTAPKFPMPVLLNAILYINSANKSLEPESNTLNHLVFDSLIKIARGGIYDQLGGGFFRYSVDEAWEIPHFEKMLYDNAQLLSLYSNAYILTSNPFFRQIIEQTIAWLVDEMKAANEGFYASIDADSEGHEGKYYVWDPFEIENHLDEESFVVFSQTFGLDEEPNFEGKWHLVLKKELCSSLLEDAKQKIKILRNQRVKPALDNKILCAWNALTLKGLAVAGSALNNSEYLTLASNLFYFIKDSLFYDNYLWVSLSNNQLKQKGFLDDYTFMLDACWSFLQAQWNKDVFEFSKRLAQRLIELFWDEKKKQFYFTSIEHEEIIYRPRTLHDDVLPSGAALAILSLQRFALLMNDASYQEIADKALKALQSQVEKNPEHYPSLMIAQSDYFSPPTLILLQGGKEFVQSAKALLLKYPSLHRYVFIIPQDASFKMIASSSNDAISICEGASCQSPMLSIDEFELYLKA